MAIQQHHGEAARNRLQLLASRAFEEDAIGGMFGYQWPTGGTDPHVVRLAAGDDILSDEYEVIIIDSGNLSGDAWKYIYHVHAQCGTEIDENI